MTNEEMNVGEIPEDDTAAADSAAMEAAKASEKAEKEAAKAAAKSEAEAAKAAAKSEAEAARAARAEERAAKREQKKAARQAAAAERSEKKQKAAADSAESETASEATSGSAESEESSVLPAKVSKEKKPKKVKPSSAKSVRRAIRPIRSRSQQTTARLIWAVFGMALVIVAIVGFWLVLSNQEDSTEVEVLVAAADLSEGNYLGYEDISMVTIDIQDGTLAYLPSSNRDSLVGRVILRDVAQDTNLSLDMFGSTNIDEEVSQNAETVFELQFPGEVTLDPDGLNPGDRVVILIGQSESPRRLAFEVVDVELVTENTIALEGSLDYEYWWEQQLTRYQNQEGIVFEILRVPEQSVAQLCWRERYRQIHQIEALTRDDYDQLIDDLECPDYFRQSGPGAAAPVTTETDPDGTTSPGDVVERLESERYTDDRTVPDAINSPADTGGGGGGGESPLGDLGIQLPAFPEG